MDKENIEYLNRIAERVNYYCNLRQKAVNFIFLNKVVDKNLTVNIMLMAAVWGAHQRNEVLTEEDLENYFRLQSTIDHETDDIQQEVLTLDPNTEHLTLNELFELTMENYK